MNKTFQLGRLTKDIELKALPSGTVVGKFTIANNHKYKKQDGTIVDEPNFFDCTAIGKTAENIGKYFCKGQRIIVIGRLKQEIWEKDGAKHSKIVIVVEEFDFVECKHSF